jgi:hypothetical protein
MFFLFRKSFKFIVMCTKFLCQMVSNLEYRNVCTFMCRMLTMAKMICSNIHLTSLKAA